MNQIMKFQSQLLNWYDLHGRKNLPWQVEDSYFVWISEIMLQQTQVLKVIDYFNAFINEFPTMKVLAAADVNEVLALWSGLGYYNRARNIHKTAQICIKDFHGELPQDLKKLMKFPGIGQTTAGAILSLASNLSYPILDGNVKRVMSRVYKINDEKVSQYNSKLWKIAANNLSEDRPKNYNQALMDLGSLVCVRSSPACHQCPLNSMCQAYLSQEVPLYPPKKTKTKQIAVTLNAILVINNDKVLLQQRENKGIWAGLWFLPELSKKDIGCENIKQNYKPLFTIQHILSHRIMAINVYKSNVHELQTKSCHWLAINQLEKYAHPSALGKILSRACSKN